VRTGRSFRWAQAAILALNYAQNQSSGENENHFHF
jgi:hypothetical protein